MDTKNERKEQLLLKNEKFNVKDIEEIKGPGMFYFSLLTAQLLLVLTGSSMVWLAIVFPLLASTDSKINPISRPITPAETSMLLTFSGIAGVLSNIFLSRIPDKIGRRNSLRLIGVLFVGIFIALAFTRNIYIFFVNFSILTIILNGAIISVTIYGCEIAKDNNRGRVGCIYCIMFPVGNMLTFIVGSVVKTDFVLFNFIFAIIAVLQIILSFFIVESPIYLALRGRQEESINTFKKLQSYDNPKDPENEFYSLEPSSDSKNKKTIFSRLFRDKASRKALILCFTVFTIQQFTGIFIILPFIVPIFNEAGTSVSGTVISLIVGFVQLTVLCAIIFVVDRTGRRPLLLLSSIGCSLMLCLLAFYLYLNDKQLPLVNSLRWLPVICITLYIVSYTLGLAHLPVIIMGELFNNEVRATAVGAILTVERIIGIILGFAYPLVTEAFGMYLNILVFGIVTFIGFILIFIFLPETRGKSFIEIQSILRK
uniref:Uncharacterized protein LOC114334944 isoform X2 n=1 Tax=Diabrotica virgifera virgifera TaxID=50390 RepID=A0A6P7G1G7_DIAVI